MSLSRQERFPIAIGNEEETMLMTGMDDKHLGDPTAFVAGFARYIPGNVKFVADSADDSVFIQNGGLMYDGGTSDEAHVNLERTTPECISPRRVAAHIQSNERLLVDMLSNYLGYLAGAGQSQEVARVQRRVMDSYGNSRACHDNFEARDPDWLERFDNDKIRQAEQVLLQYLKTRGFITGAGYIRQDGVFFSQKIAGLERIREYGYINSAYRSALEDDTGERLEIRLNDINISPWAIRARIGGAALLFTMLQTPLVGRLATGLSDLPNDSEIVDFKLFNEVKMDSEGQILPDRKTILAIDYQERVLNIMSEELERFVELPEEYREMIWEMQYYCQDFRKVLSGELSIDAIADRSDVGAKFSKIAQSIQEARDAGIDRCVGDVLSRADDLRYDHIDARIGSNGKPRITYGYGYRKRDSGGFRGSLKPGEVGRAYFNPPEYTRAKIRGELIRNEVLSRCGWNIAELQDGGGVIHLNEVVSLPNSTSTKHEQKVVLDQDVDR